MEEPSSEIEVLFADERETAPAVEQWDAASDSDSFVSAAEAAEWHARARELDAVQPEPEQLPQDQQTLYDQAMELAKNQGVRYRIDRTQETGCQTKEDFLARLHCVRIASEVCVFTSYASHSLTISLDGDAGRGNATFRC